MAKKILLGILLYIYTNGSHGAEKNPLLTNAMKRQSQRLEEDKKKKEAKDRQRKEAQQQAKSEKEAEWDTYNEEMEKYPAKLALYQFQESILFLIVKEIIDGVEILKKKDLHHGYVTALNRFTDTLIYIHNLQNEQGKATSLEELHEDLHQKMLRAVTDCREFPDKLLPKDFEKIITEFEQKSAEHAERKSHPEIVKRVVKRVRADFYNYETTSTVGLSQDFLCSGNALFCCEYPSHCCMNRPSCGYGLGTSRQAWGKKTCIQRCHCMLDVCTTEAEKDEEGDTEGGCGSFCSIFSLSSRPKEDGPKGQKSWFEWGFGFLYRDIYDESTDVHSCGIGPGCAWPTTKVQNQEARLEADACCCCNATFVSLGYDGPWVLEKLGIGAPKRPIRPE